MKAFLVRLYPRRWRDRYGEEFGALLEVEPTNPGTIADVVLGAVDAHLTAHAPERRGWWLRRLPAALIAAGALVWAVAWGVREAGFDQFTSNLASIIAPFGEVVVGLGVLSLPAAWTGDSRAAVWKNAILGMLFVVGAAAPHGIHILLADRGRIDGVGSFTDALVAVQFAAALSWAIWMLRRTGPTIPLQLLALSSGPLTVMAGSGRFGADFDPTWGPAFSGPIELWAIAWLAVGLSFLRPMRTARPEPTVVP